MKTLIQTTRIHKLDGTVETLEQTYLYAEGGYFADDRGRDVGLVIVLGSADSADNYHEVKSSVHFNPDVPESLPDIDIYEGDDEDATEEDYIKALATLGVE